MNGRKRQLLANRSLREPDWLPVTEWPEMEALREEHGRLLAERAEVAEEAAEIRRGYEAEDAARAGGLRDGYAAGEVAEAVEVTPEVERQATMEPLKARLDAVNETLAEFFVKAEDTIAAHYEEWGADLQARDAAAEERVEQARAALAEAEAGLGAHKTLEMWLHRTAGHHSRFRMTPGRHIGWRTLTEAMNPELNEQKEAAA